MKNIKPKVWDKVLNKMADDVELIDFSSNTVKIAYEQYLNGERVHPLTWYRKFEEIEFLYSTGLKDKNGVEIYEGDIVRKLNGNYKLGKVVFEFGMFCFESFGCGIYEGSDAFLHIHSLHYKEYNSENNYEVIGNIYENPELLEK